MPFIESLREKYPDMDFQILETWHNPANYKLSSTLNSKLKVEASGVPEVIVGDVVLFGAQDIPAKLEQVIIDKKKNITREIPATAVLASGPDVRLTSQTVDSIYFYGDTCSHCAKIKPLLDELEVRYPDLNLTRLEVYNDASNREHLTALGRTYGISNPGVPILFIANHVLVGDVEITDRLETDILAEQQRLASCNSTTPAPEVTPDPSECPPPQPPSRCWCSAR
jgi:glutaredoxin